MARLLSTALLALALLPLSPVRAQDEDPLRVELEGGFLTVDVSGDVQDVQVTVGGRALPRNRWGAPVRVTTGRHEVTARRAGEIVSTAVAHVPRGGDAYIELAVTPRRSAHPTSEGALRIEPASRPSAMSASGAESDPDVEGEATTHDPVSPAPLSEEPAPAESDGPVPSAEPEEVAVIETEPSSSGDGGIPSWTWWAVGGGALVVVVLVIAVAATAGGGAEPHVGDLMPGVLRW